VNRVNSSSIIIIIIAIVVCLGLGGTLLHLRSQRKQSEVLQRQAQKRSELQRSVDKLKDEIEDQHGKK
jgi:hypothetical protein